MGLDTVELVMWAERKYQIELPEEILSETETVGEFVVLIIEVHLRTHPEKSLSFDVCFNAVRDELHQGKDVLWAKITPESRIVRDLGLQ
jgi:hypothetical protein